MWDNGGKDRLFQIGLGAQKPYTKQSGWSATIAYTFSAAAEQSRWRLNPYQINNNQYIFDIPFPGRSDATPDGGPRHRLVATYTRDLPWGISMAAKLEVATPTSVGTEFRCPNFRAALQGQRVYASRPPDKTFGYKDLDLQLTKDFHLPFNSSAYVRVDLLNVFNWHNSDSERGPVPQVQCHAPTT